MGKHFKRYTTARATDKLAIKSCPRCNGLMLPDGKDKFCLACGYRTYGPIGAIAEEMRWQHDLQQPNTRSLVKTATIQEWDI